MDMPPATNDTYERPQRRRPYQPPQLTACGDLREITLGPSPGIGESGSPAIFKA
jgi:hypothetical protein